MRYTLTPREREVLNLSLQGYSTSETAQKLFITEQTVKYHRSNIIAKYGARNMVHVAGIHFQTPTEDNKLPDLQQTIFLGRLKNHLKTLTLKHEEELNSELVRVLKEAMRDLRF